MPVAAPESRFATDTTESNPSASPSILGAKRGEPRAGGRETGNKIDDRGAGDQCADDEKIRTALCNSSSAVLAIGALRCDASAVPCFGRPCRRA
jgi:hypothetical protein